MIALAALAGSTRIVVRRHGRTFGRSGAAVVQALCRPLSDASWSAGGIAIVVLMWGAMTLAMMLPSAAPMILTYAEIADTAARKGERIVSPFVLAGRLHGGVVRLCRPSRRWRRFVLTRGRVAR